MRFIFFRDRKKRILFRKFEVKKLINMSLVKSCFISQIIRSNFFLNKTIFYPKYSSKYCFRNRCFRINTSRSVRIVKGSNCNFNILSRHKFRQFASFGLLFPFRRSSW